MDRQTRKDLKTDKFAQEVGHSLEYLSEHKSQVKLYGGIAAAVIVLAAGYWIYSNRQAQQRSTALAAAIQINNAVIGTTAQPPNLAFPTQAEKDKAVIEAYDKIAADYRGTPEGAMAGLYSAGYQMDRDGQEAAIKLYQDLAGSAPGDYAAIAKRALAEYYAGEGKVEEAEKLLRDLVENPTVFVSAEEAQLSLAAVLTPTKPEEARKILESLRDTRSAVSRAAIDLIGKLPPAPQTTPAPQSN
jgi:predicted negative regulator of RcsB-dependent stress response